MTSTVLSASSPGQSPLAKTPGTPQCISNLVLTSITWPNIKPTLAERFLSLEKQIMVLIRAQTAITFRQTAVTVYFRSTQLLLFAFARQRIGGDN